MAFFLICVHQQLVAKPPMVFIIFLLILSV